MSTVEKWSIRAEIWWRTKQYAWRTLLEMIREREGLRRAVRLAWACRDGGYYWLCDACGRACKRKLIREPFAYGDLMCPECADRCVEAFVKCQEDMLAKFEAERGA